MKIALYRISGGRGSLFTADILKILDAETIPDDIDELLEDVEADFWEVLDD